MGLYTIYINSDPQLYSTNLNKSMFNAGALYGSNLSLKMSFNNVTSTYKQGMYMGGQGPVSLVAVSGSHLVVNLDQTREKKFLTFCLGGKGGGQI